MANFAHWHRLLERELAISRWQHFLLCHSEVWFAISMPLSSYSSRRSEQNLNPDNNVALKDIQGTNFTWDHAHICPSTHVSIVLLKQKHKKKKLDLYLRGLNKPIFTESTHIRPWANSWLEIEFYIAWLIYQGCQACLSQCASVFLSHQSLPPGQSSANTFPIQTLLLPSSVLTLSISARQTQIKAMLSDWVSFPSDSRFTVVAWVKAALRGLAIFCAGYVYSLSCRLCRFHDCVFHWESKVAWPWMMLFTKETWRKEDSPSLRSWGHFLCWSR